ncbi:hypothetical protein HID58_017323, partial [Brassica napus]
ELIIYMAPPPPPPSPPPVSLRVVVLFLRVLTVVFLVITVIILSTNSVTIDSQGTALKYYFKDVYAYRYMFSAAIIGLVYAVVQLFFTISELATRIKNPINYQLDFYDNIILIGNWFGGWIWSEQRLERCTSSINSTDPVDKFFSRGYASASMLLFAFVCLAVLSVFSSYAISKH